MPELRNAQPDVIERTLVFGLLLTDGFTMAAGWKGLLDVRVADRPATGPYLPFRKPREGALLFCGLPPGNDVLQVRSSRETPFYLPVDFAVGLPFGSPRWPALPNAMLANLQLALDDPSQPAAYRMQRARATLRPTTSYPFPTSNAAPRDGTTAGNPLPGAPLDASPTTWKSSPIPLGEYVMSFTASPA